MSVAIAILWGERRRSPLPELTTNSARQAAVSRQTAKLKTWLSARLFNRSRTGATLTELTRFIAR